MIHDCPGRNKLRMLDPPSNSGNEVMMSQLSKTASAGQKQMPSGSKSTRPGAQPNLQQQQAVGSAVPAEVTFEMMKKSFPALQVQGFNKIKKKHGNNAESIVKILSAEFDGWKQVEPKNLRVSTPRPKRGVSCSNTGSTGKSHEPKKTPPEITAVPAVPVAPVVKETRLALVPNANETLAQSASEASTSENQHSAALNPSDAAQQPAPILNGKVYSINLCKNSSGTNDLFEGFLENGVRNGYSRFTWADGDILLCTWINGRCNAHAEREKEKTSEVSRPQLAKTRSKTAEQAKPAKQKVATNRMGILASYSNRSGTSTFRGRACVHCKNVCTADATFQCINCQATYCQECEEKWMTSGFRKRRPPCYCVIDHNGIATRLHETDFKSWIPRHVIGHLFDTRLPSFKGLILVIKFAVAGQVKVTSTALCHMWSLKHQDKAFLLEQEIFRNYVTTRPEPGLQVFLELEKRWALPEESFPIATNTDLFGCPWSSERFIKKNPDIDSMTIDNFQLTTESINNRLTALTKNEQISVGTVWSSVKAPKYYHKVCGNNPTILVYISKHLDANRIKRDFAKKLGQCVGGHFVPATQGTNMFKQSSVSADVIPLFTVWLALVQDLKHSGHDDTDILQMERVRIVFHGWKSNPKNIIDPFADGEMYAE